MQTKSKNLSKKSKKLAKSEVKTSDLIQQSKSKNNFASFDIKNKVVTASESDNIEIIDSIKLKGKQANTYLIEDREGNQYIINDIQDNSRYLKKSNYLLADSLGEGRFRVREYSTKEQIRDSKPNAEFIITFNPNVEQETDNFDLTKRFKNKEKMNRAELRVLTKYNDISSSGSEIQLKNRLNNYFNDLDQNQKQEQLRNLAIRYNALQTGSKENRTLLKEEVKEGRYKELFAYNDKHLVPVNIDYEDMTELDKYYNVKTQDEIKKKYQKSEKDE